MAPASKRSARCRSARDFSTFREKTAVAGFMQRHKMMEFEKSRLDRHAAYFQRTDASSTDSKLATCHVREPQPARTTSWLHLGCG
jgi:hypothetical protein